jgi:hydroxymethylpyrimidine pyrophosphatase-like HAD family hydrolase
MAPPAPEGGPFRAVAIDFDGTLAEGGRPTPAVLDAVRATREAGRKVVLVTGRILDELRAGFPDVDGCFDAIVAENGAVVSFGGNERLLAAPVEAELEEALARRGLRFRRGRVLMADGASDDEVVVREIHRLGLECQVMRNRGALMILPAGVTKGRGLFEALGDLGVSRHSTVGLGDAENDHSLLSECELAVAVGNAVNALQAHADLVLAERDGQAVTSFLLGDVMAGTERVPPRRHRLVAGVDDHGAPVTIPASQVNVLIAGSSGAGKSFVLGLLAEQLVDLDYSILVIDPEGDHASIESLPGVVRVGGGHPLPPPADVLRLLRHRFGSVVVDMSLVPHVEASAYLGELWDRVQQQRASTGAPHWILIDEAHRPLGPSGVSERFLDGGWGVCLATFAPSALGREVFERIDYAIVLGGAADGAGVRGCPGADAFAGLLRQSAPLDKGRANVATLDGAPARTVTLAARRTAHVRHWHKYRSAALPPPLRFVFRHSDGQATGEVAGNVAEFHHSLRHAPPDVLRHHFAHHDLSRWLREVLSDDDLAELVEAAESEHRDDVDQGRHVVLAGIERRYLG